MATVSGQRNSIVRAVAAPTLLVCILSGALYQRFPQLTAAPRPSPEFYLGVALGVGILLACVCWRQSLAQSRSLAEMRKTLQAMGGRLEQDELEQAAEAMRHTAIVMLDPKGYIASWDRAAERLLGHTPGDAMRRHISLFYGDGDARQGNPSHDLVFAATEGRADDDRWIVRKDGFRFKASVALIAIRDPAGELCGFTYVIREDVSELSGSPAGLRL